MQFTPLHPHRNLLQPAAVSLQHQAGVALITVLLIVFLTSVAAASLASVQQLAIRRSALLLHQEQARLYTLGAEQWAVVILKRDRQTDQQSGGPVDSLVEDWANLPPALPIEGGKITGRIEDLQGRFNLNNLLRSPFNRVRSPSNRGSGGNSDESADQKSQQDEPEENDQQGSEGEENSDNSDTQETVPDSNPADLNAPNEKQLALLRQLLEVLEIDNANAITDAIFDWIDPNQEATFPDGAEDSEYLVHTPAYLAANRPFTSVSELRLIKGIDQATYDKLAPHVCALPIGQTGTTRINVNTITTPLLMALLKASGNDIDAVRAAALTEDLKKQSFKDKNQFSTVIGIAQDWSELLDVKSDYFLVQSEAQVGDGRATLYSVLSRSGDANPKVLMRSFGNEY